MLHRSIQDPIPPADAHLDTPEMADAAAAVERGERHLRVLAELTDLAMTVARSLSELAVTRIESAKAEGGLLRLGEDPAAPLNKIAQTIRRTVALETSLARDVTAGRGGLVAARTARTVGSKTAQAAAVTRAVRHGLEDAYYAAVVEAEGQNDPADRLDDADRLDAAEQLEKLFEDAVEFLDDTDEFRDYLDRPVGETVAKLCAAIGLDPDSCRLHGDVWKVRRPPYESELARHGLWKRWLGPNATPCPWGVAGPEPGPPDPSPDWEMEGTAPPGLRR